MRALLCLCSILFFICTISFPFTVAHAATAVLDTDGHPLKVGTKYYVDSIFWGALGGGLIHSKYANEDCPITVSQGPFHSKGLPCTFHPANSKESIIHLSKSLNVKFEASVPCAKSTVWQVGNYDPRTKSQLIQIGGMLGNPKCNTVRNWFKIENVSLQLRSYRFVFDPNDVCTIPIASYNLSIGGATGRPLVLSKDYPFQVRFIKYDSANGNQAYVQ